MGDMATLVVCIALTSVVQPVHCSSLTPLVDSESVHSAACGRAREMHATTLVGGVVGGTCGMYSTELEMDDLRHFMFGSSLSDSFERLLLSL